MNHPFVSLQLENELLNFEIDQIKFDLKLDLSKVYFPKKAF